MHQLLGRKICYLLLAVACGCLVVRNWPPKATAQSSGIVKEGWSLVWNDEFDGDGGLDSDKWDFEKGFVRNYEMQWYARENAFQRDGKLIPLDPYLPYEKGDTADIDIMIGTNANEMNYWIGEVGGIVPYCMTVPVKFENDMKVLTPVEKGCTKLFMNDLCGLSVWKQTEFYNETMFRLPAIRQAELHAKKPICITGQFRPSCPCAERAMP